MAFVHELAKTVDLGILMQTLLITGSLEIMNSFGLTENMLGSLVQLVASILGLYLENMGNILDDIEWVLNLELSLNLLWSVFTLALESSFE